MTKKQKNYRVSLAVLIAQQYEFETKAKDEDEAIQKAINDLHHGLSGDFVDCDKGMQDIQENFDLRDKNGIYVEEI